jgi:copper chaperone CopZ
LELWGSTSNVDEEALVVGRAVAADLIEAGFVSAEVVPHSDAAPLLPTPSRPSAFASSTSQQASRRPFLFSVQGMTCGSCVGMVETALSSVKGVVVAQVSLSKHAAIVLVDPRRRYPRLHSSATKWIGGGGK